MKVLQLCHKPPFPEVDGGSIAMSNLIKGMAQQQVEVDILAMNTFKQNCSPDEQKAYAKVVGRYFLVDIDIRVKAVDAFFNLFTSKSYNIARFESPEYEKQLVHLLKTNAYEVVIFDSLFSTPYVEVVRSLHPGIIVHRSHNVEFNIWQNLAGNERNPFKKWYLNLLTRRLKKYELSAVEKFDLIATISKPDLNEYLNHGVTTPMFHLPFGINLSGFPVHQYAANQKVKIYHVGSMNWIPHQEAFAWFFESVWSKLDHLSAKLELHLAGTGMPEWMKEKSCDNVFVSNGYVDGNEYAKGKELLIVPSFSGSGIRIKIVEAMAAGKTILTTTNGAMGLECTHGENIIISDQAEEWVTYLTDLVLSPETRERIGKKAREFCAQYHDHIKLSEKFLDKLRSTPLK